MTKIQYNLDETLRIAGDCSKDGENARTTTPELKDHIASHSGTMRTQMDAAISETDSALLNTKELLSLTSLFMKKLAEYLEQQHDDIASTMRG